MGGMFRGRAASHRELGEHDDCCCLLRHRLLLIVGQALPGAPPYSGILRDSTQRNVGQNCVTLGDGPDEGLDRN